MHIYLYEHSFSWLEQVEFESINYKCLLAFNSNFTYFILFAVISILELFRCITIYLFSTVLYNPEFQQPQCWSLTHVFLVVSLWVKVLFAIGNHKRIQTRDCCPVLFFSLAHCINVTLFDCCRLTLWMLLLQEIDEFKTGLSGVDHNIRHHPHQL